MCRQTPFQVEVGKADRQTRVTQNGEGARDTISLQQLNARELTVQSAHSMRAGLWACAKQGAQADRTERKRTRMICPELPVDWEYAMGVFGPVALYTPWPCAVPFFTGNVPP
jgi:hypothetical protein